MDRPYATQLEDKERMVHSLLDPYTPKQWLGVVPSHETGYRNKAKMQVLGYAHAPILGIVNHAGEEVSLCDCPLYSPSMQTVLNRLQSWIKEAGLTPYKVATKKGEFKYILLTQAESSGEMMLRFVLKSHKAIGQIQNYLPLLQEAFPFIKVISVNIQPIHMAILEGEEEIFLTKQQYLKEMINDVPLYMRPKSFFQTNTYVASKLYQRARMWTQELKVQSVWDLFCGVGGFGLHCASENMSLTGIEIEAEAIACAKLSAQELGLGDVSFRSLDLAEFKDHETAAAELILVNPPRRGLGKSLIQRLLLSKPAYLIYSSCNPQSLAADLAYLTDYSLEKVEIFDMFPHTEHCEVLTLLTKK